MKTLSTGHGELALPAFLPDATQAAVKTVDAADVAACGYRALMVNVLHLSARPGISLIAQIGGVHRFMAWPHVIASDSGGFQAFSLAFGPRKLATVNNDGFIYRLDPAHEKRILTPEKSIRKQFQLGADILFCLDHCTHPEADARLQRDSVRHTLVWAKRCKEEFERRCDAQETRPRLFAVVQGGADRELRRECAEQLLEIGFDGYGFGGWPIDDSGKLIDMVEYVAELIPRSIPKHGLGIGKPGNLVRAYRIGYELFDCVLPTRDARHKRLYVFEAGWEQMLDRGGEFYHCIYLQDEKHAHEAAPVEAGCDCACCRHYSRAYLRHLFAIQEPLGYRLATLHNLRFYARLLDHLRGPDPAS